MKVISGSFNGTGSALTICTGFVPDWVKLINSEKDTCPWIYWSNRMRSLACEEGILYTPNAAPADLVQGEGVAAYFGGVLLSSASTSILVIDPKKDKRDANTAAAAINAWVLDTAGNKTGHFNAAVNSTYVGVGSRIGIKTSGSNDVEWAYITVSDGTGTGANSIEISRALPSGEVVALHNMYDYRGAAAGIMTPEGFVINHTGDVNTSGEMAMFEAGQYDNR